METIAVLQRFASPVLDRLMLGITYLGDEQAYIALLVILYLGVSPVLGRRLGIVLMLSFFLNFHLKGIVDTPRPFALDPSVARGEAVATAPGAGFPSGHVQGSTTFWGYLALQVRRPGIWAAAVVIVVLIALSRLYLGVHVPLDVVGGLLIGAAVVAVAQLVVRHRLITRIRSRQPWPRPLLLAAGAGGPLVVHLALPVTDSALLMGGLAAFVTAPLMLRYQPPVGAARRAVAAGLGLVLVFGALLGSSYLLPEAVKQVAVVGYVRYLLIGYVGLVLAPYLVRRVGLTRRSTGGEAGRLGRDGGDAPSPSPLPLEESTRLGDHRTG